MLSAKNWKTDAVMRLLLAMFVCIYAASVVGSIGRIPRMTGKTPPGLVYAVAVGALCLLAATLVVLGKSWSLDTIMRRVPMLLLFFYTGFFGGAWVQKMVGVPETTIGQLLLSSLALHGAGLLLIWRFTAEHQVSWAEGFGFGNHRRHAVVLGLTMALIVLPVGWGLQQLSAFVMTHAPYVKIEPKEQATVQVLQATSNWMPRVAMGVMAVFVAPVTEEMLFRGIFYPWVKQLGYPRLALWGTSLVFAAIHVNLVTFAPLLVLALALTLLYERTGNLLAPITSHAIFNALNFATLWLFPEK